MASICKHDSKNAGKSSHLGKHGFGSLYNFTWACYHDEDILLRHRHHFTNEIDKLPLIHCIDAKRIKLSKSGTTAPPDTVNGNTDDEQTCDPFLTGPDKMYNVTSYALRCLYYCDAGSSQETSGDCMAGDWSSGGTTVKTPSFLFILWTGWFNCCK